MTVLQVSILEPLKTFIDDLLDRGEYKDAGEYVQALIERDRRSREEAALETLLLDGLDSGPSQSVTEGTWDEIEREGLAFIAGPGAKPGVPEGRNLN